MVVVFSLFDADRLPNLARRSGISPTNTMNKEARLKASINQKLTETGERDRLKELLRAKLTECGWKDQMKAQCKEMRKGRQNLHESENVKVFREDVIKQKGLEHVTVEDLVVEVTPKGRALVPDSVKKELLQRIRAFLTQHAS